MRKYPNIRSDVIGEVAFKCKMNYDNSIIQDGIDLIARESKSLQPNLEAVRVAVREILNEGKAGRSALLCILKAPLPSKVKKIIIDGLGDSQ